jgi:hypothetical protein
MSDQAAEPQGLTDEQIAPDQTGGFASPAEATDPDIRNTTQGQDDGQDPVDQSDPQSTMESQDDDEVQSGPVTSPTD